MTKLNLVTGGAGFVGKELVKQLRAKGERVRSFDLAPPSHIDDIQGSITDSAAVIEAMGEVDTVFHLAGNAQLWARDERVFDDINRAGTAVVIDAAIKAGVRKFVHCSSLTTLVSNKTPVGFSKADETIEHSPVDMFGAYPRSKREAEIIVHGAARNGLDTVIVLPTEPLGPGDEALTPPTKMILDFANGATPAYIDCILNFVPVPSLAQGMIAAAEKGRAGERYLLGGENTPMRDLLATISAITGAPAPKMKMPYWVALGAGAVDTKIIAALTGKPPKAPLTGVRLAGRNVSFSSAKAARELGWRASPYEPALYEAISWFADKGWLQKKLPDRPAIAQDGK
ncbi:MAG: NAD-dependent epimerase/dehydratase family protein [Pseudomonadota bacterium]